MKNSICQRIGVFAFCTPAGSMANSSVMTVVEIFFLTEETLLSRRAPIKEALPSPNVFASPNHYTIATRVNSMQCGTRQ